MKSDEALDGSIHYRVVTVETDEKRELSTAEGTFGTSKTQGLDIKIGEDEKPNEETSDTPKIIPAGWDLFNDILAELEKDTAIKTRILSFSSEADSFTQFSQPKGIYFPCTVNGRTASWAFLDEERSQRRQAMLAEIRNNDRIYYLFDTEVNLEDENDRYSMLVVNNEDFKVLDDQFWKTLLTESVKNRGRKRDSWSWNKTKHSPVRHDLKEIAKYTLRIKEFFAQ